jgi:hypothetical protein
MFLLYFSISNTSQSSKHCNYCRKSNHNEEECCLKQRHEADKNRGREHHRGRSRGCMHQSHFVESSTIVPQEPAIDYLFMASYTNISTSQCVRYIDSGATKHMTGKQNVFSKLVPVIMRSLFLVMTVFVRYKEEVKYP